MTLFRELRRQMQGVRQREDHEEIRPVGKVAQHHDEHEEVRQQKHRLVEHDEEFRRTHHGGGAAPHARVMNVVAPVVHGEHGGRHGSQGHAEQHGIEGEHSGLQVVGPTHGREAEEDQNDQLPEGRVGDGLGAAHVGVGRKNRSDADREEHDPAVPNENGGVEQGQKDSSQERVARRLHGNPSVRRRAGKPAAIALLELSLRVSAVVLHVRDDLHQHGDGEREKGDVPLKTVLFAHVKGKRSEDGRHGNAPGFRTHVGEPRSEPPRRLFGVLRLHSVREPL